jgi:hypothetical protein
MTRSSIAGHAHAEGACGTNQRMVLSPGPALFGQPRSRDASHAASCAGARRPVVSRALQRGGQTHRLPRPPPARAHAAGESRTHSALRRRALAQPSQLTPAAPAVPTVDPWRGRRRRVRGGSQHAGAAARGARASWAGREAVSRSDPCTPPPPQPGRRPPRSAPPPSPRLQLR